MLLGVDACRNVQADPAKIGIDALLADLHDAVYTGLTKTALQSAINSISATSGITIDGIVKDVPGEFTFDDIHVVRTTCRIFLTYVKPT